MTRGALLSLVLVMVLLNASAQACELYDRACWQAKRDREARPDASGYTLPQRSAMCEDMAMAVEGTAQQVLAHVFARHLVASPTGKGFDYNDSTDGAGYLDHADVHEFDREIGIIVNVAARDIRMLRYSGANLDRCAGVAHEAMVNLWQIKDALP